METTLELESANIKENFHKLIDNFKDVKYLEKLYESILDQLNNESSDFSDFDIKNYESTVNNVKKGKFSTHENMLKKTKIWLMK